MDNKTLTKKREELEKTLERKEKAHYGKFWHKEGAYQDSVKEIRDIYDELSEVAQELGDPIPIWF